MEDVILRLWTRQDEVSGLQPIPFPRSTLSWLDCAPADGGMHLEVVAPGAGGWVDRHAVLVGRGVGVLQFSSFATQSMRELHPIFNLSRVSFSPQEVSGCRELEWKMEREMC